MPAHNGRINRWIRPGPIAACALLAAGLVCAAASGQAAAPRDTEGIGIFEHLDAQVPLDLRFTGEDGGSVALGELFDGSKPVLLTLVYYRCPGICNALLNGLVFTLNDLEWTAGQEFRIVTVSIDPTESSDLAAGKKRSYLSAYERPGAEEGWRFLVGEQADIETLAETVGFGYRYEQRTGQYTHAATLMVCTPDGRISRYLNDVIFEPQTLQLALTEASQGTIGTPVNRFLLKWCYAYDPSAGKYVVAAQKLMAIGGVVMVLLTAGGLTILWRRELKARKASQPVPRKGVAEPQP